MYFFWPVWLNHTHSGVVLKIFSFKQVTHQHSLWLLKIMMSKVVQETWIHMGMGSFLGGSWSSNRCPCIANKPLSIYFLFPATWQEAASMVFMFSKIANFVLFARSDLRLGLLYLILCLGEYLHQWASVTGDWRGKTKSSTCLN